MDVANEKFIEQATHKLLLYKVPLEKYLQSKYQKYYYFTNLKSSYTNVNVDSDFWHLIIY